MFSQRTRFPTPSGSDEPAGGSARPIYAIPRLCFKYSAANCSHGGFGVSDCPVITCDSFTSPCSMPAVYSLQKVRRSSLDESACVPGLERMKDKNLKQHRETSSHMKHAPELESFDERGSGRVLSTFSVVGDGQPGHRPLASSRERSSQMQPTRSVNRHWKAIATAGSRLRAVIKNTRISGFGKIQRMIDTSTGSSRNPDGGKAIREFLMAKNAASRVIHAIFLPSDFFAFSRSGLIDGSIVQEPADVVVDLENLPHRLERNLAEFLLRKTPDRTAKRDGHGWNPVGLAFLRTRRMKRQKDLMAKKYGFACDPRHLFAIRCFCLLPLRAHR